ncbi:MAG: alpha/beta fold hydrolase [Armatimonadetes bacterium]|nr:alpha/beta fold hydrolase [Armatimonadota bacterium]MBX3109014.1 alpha/beta fold hydrolase [Fimbriimonadaceae bacterium]
MAQGSGTPRWIPESMRGLALNMGRVPTPEEALRIFATPTRAAMARKETEVAGRGDRFEFVSDATTLTGWRWGAGPRILLMHGWNGRALNLSSFVDPLVDAGFDVVAFDAHAHGESGGDYCYAPRFARAVLDLERLTGPFEGVVAHSFGTCAATVAQKEGWGVSRAVYLSTMCFIKERFFEFGAALGLDEGGQQAMWEFGDQVLEPGYIESCHGDVAARAFSSQGLVFHDEGDQEIGIMQSEAIVESWGRSELVRTTGLGHFRLIRSPQVVSRAVGFFKEGK